MKDGENEKFRIYMSSGEKEIEQLNSDCTNVSAKINQELRDSPDPRPLINPVQVFVSSYTLDQPESHSGIWISVNSTWQIAEKARLELEKVGYKTGEII